jgi:hypothetical protein
MATTSQKKEIFCIIFCCKGENKWIKSEQKNTVKQKRVELWLKALDIEE